MGYYDLLLGIHPEETIIQKDTRTPMTSEAVFTIAEKWNLTTRSSTDE